MKRFIILFTLLATASIVYGQRSQKAASAWLIQPSYSYLFSGGDMENRFGDFMGVGLGVGYKTANNWIVSVDAQFTFGNNVKNVGPLLNTMLTKKGNILNETGNYGDIDVNQRGWLGSLDVSKTFNFLSVNPNSGINLLFGAGGLWHYINFNTPGKDIPQVMGEYDKGYDEMSGGFMLKQSIGYVYLSRNRRVNFKISFEIMEAFTTNYRKFSYSTGKPVTGTMNDFIYGFKAQWILPIYGTQSTGGNHYYYD
ncbi:hypothetical protein Oweho_1672 [Owenweeksia hongkongensis DSM 17368]|uniref:Outer membrane protein beta-barrel domain-containing protein n=1 Tax=Owenweeksia hongkongensis (strain DSM 17368 / CIP 108786 / JCM 12287 / NRRL B-23963 / UST20020801) TaxID=926562 RepID=G8R020_OWEHD|nr:hypothetical protein [Owenweeksia hongkongensis]AEV32660.1 hypothetical protein Oweho_1672 [Owenweeksia hongkongensis DSM 17368]